MARQRYQGSPEWLAERKGGIGASEAATLVLGDEKSWRELFAIKLGILPDREANETMALGIALEPVIANAYTARTGHRVRRVDRVLRHRELDFVRASLDRRRPGAVVELKKWGFPTADFGPDGSDQVPDAFAYQCQQQLSVTGLPIADIAVLFGGRELRVYTLGRDEGTIDGLLALETRAWAYVARGEVPPWPGPAPVRPMLAEGEIEADEQLTAFVRRYQAAEADLDLMEAERNAARRLIQERLADVGAVRGDGFRISYRPNKDSVKVAWEQVAIAYRKAAIARGADEVELAAIESLFTTTAPGARPLRVTIEKGALIPA